MDYFLGEIMQQNISQYVDDSYYMVRKKMIHI